MRATTRHRVLAVGAAALAAAVLSSGPGPREALAAPILHYPFDIGTTTGGSGTTVEDLSPAGNDGQITGGSLTQQSGTFGNALRFASGRYVLVGSSGSPTALLSTSDASQPYTISAWLNSTAGGGIVTQYSGSSSSTRFGTDTRTSAGGKAQWWSGGTTRAIGTNDVNDGTWHHVAFTKDSSQNVVVYVDGQDETAAGTNKHTTAFENTGTKVGAYLSGTLPFTGRIDEVRVFDQALNAGQIYNLYTSNSVTAPEHPVLRVDLGDVPGETGTQNVQSGWRGVSALETDSSGAAVQQFDYGHGPMTMTLSGPPDAPNWNNRGGSMTHPLSDMSIDFAYNNSNQPLNVEFDTLPAGRCYLRTYHHDNLNDYGEIGRVSVTDALGTDRTIATDVPITTGKYGPVGKIGTVPVMLQSDGISPVVVAFTPTTDPFTHFNGFELTRSLPVNLHVDFELDSSNDPPETQGGFQSYAHPTADLTTPGEQELWFFTDVGNQGSAGVSFSRLTNNFSIRNRADVTHALGDLAEDFVASGDDLILTLTDLRKGLYRITTYHHDRIAPWGEISVDLEDALGLHPGVVSGLAQTTGGSPSEIASALVHFESNGVDPVRLTFLGDIVILNGLSLQLVPEPASAAVWALGLLGLLGFARRRKRARPAR